jgi:S1-C subfamily serine protease
MSIVTVNSYQGKTILTRGSGFVVQSDRFNGYVVTNSSYLEGSDTTTISIPNSGAELVARVLRNEPSYDFALLKVNGLNIPPLEFG